jgi:copper homeostasis protein (lipoprotein)
MRLFNRLLYLSMLALLACQGNNDRNAENEDAQRGVESMSFAEGNQSALDWTGMYKGVVPCDDCEGIETTLILEEDLSYHLRRELLGKDTAVEDVHGKFAFNTEGSVILLAGIAQDHNKYLVGETMVAQLDEDGKIITGTLAEKYELRKFDAMAECDVSLQGTHWKLMTLMGEPIETSTDNTKDPFIMLGGTNNYMNAFTGCNNIVGHYTTEGNDRIKFTDISRTKKACPDNQLEDKIVEVLETTDGYYFAGDTLVLHEATREPLAMFQAIGAENVE